MKKKNLGVIILLAVVIIVAIFFVVKIFSKPEEQKGLGNKEEYTVQKENGDKENTSNKLKEDREELGYKINKITLKKEGIQTIFKIDITNDTKSTKKMQLVDIVFVDKAGKELSRMALMIREIKAGETITTQATIDSDLTNVYNFKLQTR